MSEAASNQKVKKSWFKGLKAEFKKIIWPDKMTVARQTTTVVVISLALGVIIKVVDMLVQAGFSLIFPVG
jgi:preprotein translocase subunit SecE